MFYRPNIHDTRSCNKAAFKFLEKKKQIDEKKEIISGFFPQWEYLFKTKPYIPPRVYNRELQSVLRL